MPRMTRADARLARSARSGAPRTTTFIPLLLLLACAPVLATPAFGAPTYALLFERSGYPARYNVTKSTPMQYSDEFLISSDISGNSTFTGSAFAYPGHVGVVDHLETFWAGIQAASRYDVYSTARADDFVITGPTGPWVTGQLHFRVRARLACAGGYAGSASHGARLNVDARARFGALLAMGDLYSTNHDTHGTGILTGITDPNLDFAFVLAGSYPVGTPFDIVIKVFGGEYTYGNGGSVPNPGYAETDGGSTSSYGLFLEEVSGQVMTLPAGYTLNSASWHVADNHYHTLVGVESAPGAGALRLSAQPNPSFGASTVSFDQPQAAHLRLQVFDVGGRLVRTLANEWRAAGTQSFEWDGRSDSGEIAEPGLYFLRAEAGGLAASRRIVRIPVGGK